VARLRPLLLAGLCALGGWACAAPAPALAAHGRAHRSAARSHRRERRRSGACRNAGLIPTGQNLGLIRSATLCLVNRERRARGERPLQQNTRLERAAQGHTDSMSFGDYFDHVGPGGQTPLNRMRATGYIYSSRIGYEVGENIAWGSGWQSSPRVIVAAWMASPGHRANILDPRFRDTAIGVCADLPSSLARGQRGAVYTQDFGVIVG
jgi:uncharacterized protein YkwD